MVCLVTKMAQVLKVVTISSMRDSLHIKTLGWKGNEREKIKFSDFFLLFHNIFFLVFVCTGRHRQANTHVISYEHYL